MQQLYYYDTMGVLVMCLCYNQTTCHGIEQRLATTPEIRLTLTIDVFKPFFFCMAFLVDTIT